MEEKITLDKAAFKALASETRVSLLKKLGNRRATPSELAQSLGISAQAASEHLAQLEKAGLVKRDSRPEDEGRKWVYYSLTEKGRALVRPEDQKRIWVLLGTGVLALAVGFSRFFLQSGFTGALGAANGAASSNQMAVPAALQATVGALAEDGMRVAESKALETTMQYGSIAESSVPPSPTTFFYAAGSNAPCAGCGGATPVELLLIVAGCLLLSAGFYYYLKSRPLSKKLKV